MCADIEQQLNTLKVVFSVFYTCLLHIYPDIALLALPLIGHLCQAK